MLCSYRLGDLIEQSTVKNSSLQCGEDKVRGISTDKCFIETKANLSGVNLANYKRVPENYFAYVADTSRRGDKISLAFNQTDDTFLVSSISTVFKVKSNKETVIIPEFLFMYFNRPEFDRFARFNSWGSAREVFSWDDFCEISLKIPALDIQKKYVAIYEALTKNQQAYAKGLEDLKLVCDGYLDQLKGKNVKPLNELLIEKDIRNHALRYNDVRGIDISKSFIPTKANIANTSLKNYKVIKKNQIAFSGMQTGRDKCIRVALMKEENPFLISPAYTVFEISNDLIPEFLMLWFLRKEIDRYGWFLSDASIRANLEIARFEDIKIPLPPKAIQQDIVDIYKVYRERKRINEQLKHQLKAICPVLIQGAMQEGRNNS